MTLPAIQTTSGVFTICEFDRGPKIADLLGLDLTTQNAVIIVRQILNQLILNLSPQSSGVLVDPIYGFDFLESKASKVGTILRLEQVSSETDPLNIPTLIPNWSIDDIKNNYALAKMELYYHPREEHALHKKQLLAELYDFCQYEKVPLLLKLMIYTPADEEFNELNFQEAQLEAVQELRGFCDLMALQFPHDPLSVATLTAELDIPWILTTEGTDYSNAKEILRTVLENGAKGFLAGDIFYQDINKLRKKDQSPDFEQIERFIQTTARDRIIELVRIAEEIAGKKI